MWIKLDIPMENTAFSEVWLSKYMYGNIIFKNQYLMNTFLVPKNVNYFVRLHNFKNGILKMENLR